MSRIVAYVLGLNKEITKAMDHYIDDIILNTEALRVKAVVAHLANFFGSEKIDDVKVVGLTVSIFKKGKLVWQRSNTVEELTRKVTRHQLFSIT